MSDDAEKKAAQYAALAEIASLGLPYDQDREHCDEHDRWVPCRKCIHETPSS